MKRYYRRMYLTLLEMCYLNAFVVYNHLAAKKVTYLEYKKMVVMETVQKYVSQRTHRTPAVPHLSRRKLPGLHYPCKYHY